MSEFGNSNDPRVRRSFAHAMLASWAEGRVGRGEVQAAIGLADQTAKGDASHFDTALLKADQRAREHARQLRLRVRINPGNVALVPGNSDYEIRRAAMLNIKRAQHAANLHDKVAAGELDCLPGGNTQTDVVTAEAARLAERDFEVAATLAGWGLGHEGIVYNGADISYITDRNLLLGDCALEGDQDFQVVFSQLRTLAA